MVGEGEGCEGEGWARGGADLDAGGVTAGVMEELMAALVAGEAEHAGRGCGGLEGVEAVMLKAVRGEEGGLDWLAGHGFYGVADELGEVGHG